MLDQLVESRNDSNNTRRGGFLLTTSILIVSLFASGILWSLFAKDLGGNENLELSSLVTPVKLPEDTPPPPEPVKQIKPDQSQKTESYVPVRQVNMARVDEPIMPPRFQLFKIQLKRVRIQLSELARMMLIRLAFLQMLREEKENKLASSRNKIKR